MYQACRPVGSFSTEAWTKTGDFDSEAKAAAVEKRGTFPSWFRHGCVA